MAEHFKRVLLEHGESLDLASLLDEWRITRGTFDPLKLKIELDVDTGVVCYVGEFPDYYLNVSYKVDDGPMYQFTGTEHFLPIKKPLSQVDGTDLPKCSDCGEWPECNNPGGEGKFSCDTPGCSSGLWFPKQPEQWVKLITEWIENKGIPQRKEI